MKKMLALVLAAMLLLSGCSTEEMPDATEGQIHYEWMTGESPVSPQRTGLFRAGLNMVDHEVTSGGVYFISNDFILFSDDHSDSIIKLCGRPDCTHNNQDCNAYIKDGCQIAYYNGYLYAVTGNQSEEECKLVRMDLSGGNRIEILDLLEFAKENGGDFVVCEMVTNGTLLFSTYGWVEQDGGEFGGSWLEYYTYPLDGSESKPKAVDSKGWFNYNCGNVLLTYMAEAKYGGEYGSFWNWNMETDTLTYLCDHPGSPGYFSEEKGYYYRDGAVRCLNYETQEEAILIETGMEGDYYALCLPDCIVVVSRDTKSEGADQNLYIYNWGYELVDQIELTYPKADNLRMEHAVIAETSERFILTNAFQGLPMYYIEKSELGTGTVKVHAFKLPDLTAELECYEDQEWLNNG